MNYQEIEIESIGVAQTHIVLDLGDGNYKSFPADTTNPEYVAFLKQLEETA